MKEESFGVIPIMRKENNFNVLLIQYGKGYWGFPKGRAQEGETELQTAQREFEEETGVKDYKVLEHKKYSESFFFKRYGKLVNKTVQYFVAFVYTNKVSIQKEEVDAYRWVNILSAEKYLSFPGGKKIIEEVRRALSITA